MNGQLYEESKIHVRATGYSYSDSRGYSGDYCGECRVCEAYESGFKDTSSDLEKIKEDVTQRLNAELHEDNCSLKERVAALEDQLSAATYTGVARSSTDLDPVVPATSHESTDLPDRVAGELVEQLRVANRDLSLTTQLRESRATRKALLASRDKDIEDLTAQLHYARSVSSHFYCRVIYLYLDYLTYFLFSRPLTLFSSRVELRYQSCQLAVCITMGVLVVSSKLDQVLLDVRQTIEP